MKTQSERINAALDAALSMTFPASDPIAPYISNEPRLRSFEDEAARASNKNWPDLSGSPRTPLSNAVAVQGRLTEVAK